MTPSLWMDRTCNDIGKERQAGTAIGTSIVAEHRAIGGTMPAIYGNSEKWVKK